MRIIPKGMRKEGVLESLKNDQVVALVEEAEYAMNQGYYDEDGNWISYFYDNNEAVAPEEVAAEPPRPIVEQPKPQKQPPPSVPKDEVKAAADEAAKAAQEAAKAAAEASQSLVKGLTSFGFGLGGGSKSSNQQQSGFSLGGLMKAAAGEPVKPAPPKVVPKPAEKPQDPNFLKPCTNNMNAKQRWQWGYRRIVQVPFSFVVFI